jgi:DNA end-binding protein Ku
MARAIWKGVVSFEDVEVPVKLYSAVQERGVHFRLLHEKDLEPVQQRMVNPVTGKVVEYEDVRRGFEVERGVFVLIDDDELEALEPEPSRTIEITRFVPPGTITHQWYDRPYFLGPDDDEGAYFALARALAEQEREGVARWVMRKKSYAGALRAEGDHLALITLRNAGEVVPVSALEAPGGRALDERELRMAKQLIAALEDEFDPTEYRDEFRDRVLELVHAKAEGRSITRKRAAKKAPQKPLAALLEASVASARKEKRVA